MPVRFPICFLRAFARDLWPANTEDEANLVESNVPSRTDRRSALNDGGAHVFSQGCLVSSIYQFNVGVPAGVRYTACRGGVRDSRRRAETSTVTLESNYFWSDTSGRRSPSRYATSARPQIPRRLQLGVPEPAAAKQLDPSKGWALLSNRDGVPSPARGPGARSGGTPMTTAVRSMGGIGQRVP
jgi:hypothetical protein